MSAVVRFDGIVPAKFRRLGIATLDDVIHVVPNAYENMLCVCISNTIYRLYAYRAIQYTSELRFVVYTVDFDELEE